MTVHEIKTMDGKCPRHWELEVNGKSEMSMCDLNEIPEDAMLCRGMIDVFKVKDLMRKAYSAGKAGEEFQFTEEVNNDYTG